MRFRIHWHHRDGHTEETEHEAIAPTTIDVPEGVQQISVEDLDKNVGAPPPEATVPPIPPAAESDVAAGLTP